MNERDMQHGKTYKDQDVSGYVATEKYNGCRAYWDGEVLWSRGGLAIDIPDSWLAAFPKGIHLDGEVYDGIDGFHRTVSAVKYGNFTPSMKFMVFECPSFQGKYQDKLAQAKQYENGLIIIVSSWRVTGITEAISQMKDIHSRSGEGMVLRDPDLQYAAERTDKVIKLKKDPSQVIVKKKSSKRRPGWTKNAQSFSISV